MTTADQPSVHYRNCNLCEAICGIVITGADGSGRRQEPESVGRSRRQKAEIHETPNPELETRNSELETRNYLDIRGDKDDPFSRGYICPKAVALQDLHYDKDR